jgi:hypothetical protein
MLNSIQNIESRAYFLYNKNHTGFVKAVYQEKFWYTNLDTSEEFISFKDIDKQIAEHDFLAKFNRALEISPEKWAVTNMTPTLKQSLLFSYYLRFVKKNKKLANVQTENWLKIPAFAQARQELLAKCNVANIVDPVGMINAIIRVTGKHKTNLRFGHIHLSFDILDNRQIYGVHWDASAVDLNSSTILTHWLNDDIPS